MDPSSALPTPPPSAQENHAVKEKESLVDPFLVEALQNPRHRLTILRMELDIQKFMQNPDLQQFEFQHFPTSYLRLAAHRVAQHYCLPTMVQDSTSLDGVGNKIVAIKTAESKYPPVCLSEIPAKQGDNDRNDQIKVVIKPRPGKGSANDANRNGNKRSPVRTMEERKEEYDRARARIFNGNSSSDLDDVISQVPSEGKSLSLSKDDAEEFRNPLNDADKMYGRDAFTSSRVAIFRDREKDRIDPDYDRSYERYVRNLPINPGFNFPQLHMQKSQLPYMPYDAAFAQMGQIPGTQSSLSYGHLSSPLMSPYPAVGSADPTYMQWPAPAMMYAHSYEQFRHAVFQAPMFQQPLTFNHSQNLMNQS